MSFYINGLHAKYMIRFRKHLLVN